MTNYIRDTLFFFLFFIKYVLHENTSSFVRSSTARLRTKEIENGQNRPKIRVVGAGSGYTRGNQR